MAHDLSTVTADAVSSTTTAAPARAIARAYERPTLTKIGGFRENTGLVGRGSPDLLGGHSLL
ncbi:keywimysin-related RiPP [Streptomyces enissocaesilis]|uniref:Lasso RiPP family leader peptide-containing protein n=1 Tax=Streptomyces enissocaesilis TaxID=332589 RepID=A0ABP6K885_9ACTN